MYLIKNKYKKGHHLNNCSLCYKKIINKKCYKIVNQANKNSPTKFHKIQIQILNNKFKINKNKRIQQL